MYRILIFVLMSFSATAQVFPPIEYEQEKKEEPKKEEVKIQPAWKDKIHYGGNIWAGFAGSFYFDAAPMVAYELTENGNTMAGIGASIIYSGSSKAYGGGLSIGPRFFVRQGLWRTLFAHAEYELMNSSPYNFYDTRASFAQNQQLDPKNKWGGTGYVGLGFYQNGMRLQKGAFISVLYNLGAPNNGFIPQQRIDSEGRFVFRIGFLI